MNTVTIDTSTSTSDNDASTVIDDVTAVAAWPSAAFRRQTIALLAAAWQADLRAVSEGKKPTVDVNYVRDLVQVMVPDGACGVFSFAEWQAALRDASPLPRLEEQIANASLDAVPWVMPASCIAEHIGDVVLYGSDEPGGVPWIVRDKHDCLHAVKQGHTGVTVALVGRVVGGVALPRLVTYGEHGNEVPAYDGPVSEDDVHGLRLALAAIADALEDGADAAEPEIAQLRDLAARRPYGGSAAMAVQ